MDEINMTDPFIFEVVLNGKHKVLFAFHCSIL